MAILKYKDIEKMNEKERTSKLSDLKKELIKTKVTGAKAGTKISIKEIKKAIAKLLTFENTQKGTSVPSKKKMEGKK